MRSFIITIACCIFLITSHAQKTATELGESIALAFKAEDFSKLKALMPTVEQLARIAETAGFKLSEEEFNEFKETWPLMIKDYENTFDDNLEKGRNIGIEWSRISITSVNVIPLPKDYMGEDKPKIEANGVQIFIASDSNKFMIEVPITFYMDSIWHIGDKQLSVSKSGLKKTPLVISTAWYKIIEALQRTTDLIPNIIKVLSSQKKIEKELSELKTANADLDFFLESFETLDSLSVSKTGQLYGDVKTRMTKILSYLEKNPAQKTTDFENLMIHLQGAENRFHVARHDYNELCSKYDRADLLFILKVPAPKVSFEDNR